MKALSGSNVAGALRRRAVLAGAVTALLAAAMPAHAQAVYPHQPVKLVVPYAAGGLPDVIARILAAKWQERIGQNVVVENRPGGAGAVAVGALQTSPADGLTLIVTDSSIVSVNPTLIKSLSYAAKDLIPVAMAAQAPLFLAINSSVPVNSLKEFIDYVKANPNTVNYGSSGVGSLHHISMEALKAATGLQMTHVPYRGTGQSVPALIGGHVQALFSAPPSLAAAIADKRVKLLATNGAQPSPNYPDVPTIASIIPGFDLASRNGVYARAGTPPELVSKIAADVMAVVAMPETQKQLANAGIEPAPMGAEPFAQHLAKETAFVAKVIETAGMKVD